MGNMDTNMVDIIKADITENMDIDMVGNMDTNITENMCINIEEITKDITIFIQSIVDSLTMEQVSQIVINKYYRYKQKLCIEYQL